MKSQVFFYFDNGKCVTNVVDKDLLPYANPESILPLLQYQISSVLGLVGRSIDTKPEKSSLVCALKQLTTPNKIIPKENFYEYFSLRREPVSLLAKRPAIWQASNFCWQLLTPIPQTRGQQTTTAESEQTTYQCLESILRKSVSTTIHDPLHGVWSTSCLMMHALEPTGKQFSVLHAVFLNFQPTLNPIMHTSCTRTQGINFHIVN